MKKSLLTLAVAMMAASSAMADTIDKGELPLGEQFTLSKDEVYTFTPEADGILSIEFEGSWPDTSLIWSDLYTSNNPTMELLPYGSINANPAMGQQSPADFEIRKFQPAESGSTAAVVYKIIGPDEQNLLDPANSLTSIKVTCTFSRVGSEGALMPTIDPEPNTTLGYYDIGNLSVSFVPQAYNVTCSGINIDLYEGETLKKSVEGSTLEMRWEYIPSESRYNINLQNLLLYELEGSAITKFVITLSGFSHEISGNWTNDEGDLVLPYTYDALYGQIALESMTALPTLSPNPAAGTKLTLTYAAEIEKSNSADVQLIGANLSGINSEPSPRTNVYSVSYTIDGKNLVIDFSNYKQTGPVDDSGNIISTDGIRTSGSVMTLIVRGFQGTNGEIVQAVMEHLNWTAEDPEPGDNPGGEEPGGDEPGDEPGDNPGGDQPGDEPGDQPGDQPGDEPGDNPGGDDSGVNAVEGEATITVYNLQGIRVLEAAPADALTSLPAGLYIVNGRKVINR